MPGKFELTPPTKGQQPGGWCEFRHGGGSLPFESPTVQANWTSLLPPLPTPPSAPGLNSPPPPEVPTERHLFAAFLPCDSISCFRHSTPSICSGAEGSGVRRGSVADWLGSGPRDGGLERGFGEGIGPGSFPLETESSREPLSVVDVSEIWKR